MAGINAPGPGGHWLPMGSKFGMRTRQTFDKDTVEQVAKLLNEEKANCAQCVPGMPVKHATLTARVDGPNGPWAMTYQCRSGSRWFNPETGQMEGREHCTCDGCF
jgi:hypothetical protein